MTPIIRCRSVVAYRQRHVKNIASGPPPPPQPVPHLLSPSPPPLLPSPPPHRQTRRHRHARQGPPGSKFSRPSEATHVSVCIISVNWNDYTGGVSSDRHPEEQYFQGLRMPVDFVPTSLVKHYVPRISGGDYWCVTEVVSSVSVKVSTDRAGRSLLPRRWHCSWCCLRVDSAWISLCAQQITSCTPSTGTFGCYGCDVGWTEWACVHLSTDAGLAISFYVPHVLCLTEETASVECPTEKVANITGVSAGLIGVRKHESLAQGIPAGSSKSHSIRDHVSPGCF